MTVSEEYLGATEFDIGDLVESVKALRQDGTFPDPSIKIGDILVEPGTRGVVINTGLYLQQHVVYAVSFENGRIVGCLTREITHPQMPNDAHPHGPQPHGR
jgi:hypothetical protein